MKHDNDTVASADRIGRARAALLPVTGILLIVANAVWLETGEVGWAWWLAVFALGFAVVVSGGVVLRRLRVLTDDETARAHRLAAVFTGYCATVACAAGLFVVSAVIEISAREALQIVLATAIAAPLIGFGVRERASFG